MPDSKSGDRIGLRLRQRSSPLRPGESPALFVFDKAMLTAEADRTFGTGMIVTAADVRRESLGTASVQLVDLSDIGAVSTSPGQTLRVLARLSVGGYQVKLSNDAVVLPAGHFAGQSARNAGNWIDGELYLMSFWVQGEDNLIRYDVLLEQSADGPAH